ncbi:uncharacterized protein VTP21DRAFT_6222 [Calcarisporiella thermophila]|uniref:uncharacterized protein n=1 Tax=Calcarisporiella thermophila TaxID=911321 RepID=UPI0037434D13
MSILIYASIKGLALAPCRLPRLPRYAALALCAAAVLKGARLLGGAPLFCLATRRCARPLVALFGSKLLARRARPRVASRNALHRPPASSFPAQLGFRLTAEGVRLAGFANN